MRRRNIQSSGSRSARTFPPPQNFTDLADTFPSYATKANQFLVVNAGETKVTSVPLPPIAITDTFVCNSQAAMLALTAQTGDICIRTDTNQTYILQGTDPAILANWQLLLVSPVHDMGGALHTADTLTHIKSKISAPDILITSQAAEISTLTAKASPTTSDLILIEDAADSNNKKKITIANLPAAAPAAHDLAGTLHNADTITNLNSKLSDGDVISTKAAELYGMTVKIPVSGDLILIEDAADSYNKKAANLGLIPVQTHDFAGSIHNASLLNEVNSKISDANVISDLGNEFNLLIPAKAVPTTADLLLIEDAADSFKKKSISILKLPAAAPAAHNLAGTLHNADTITNLNSKLSDGDVISTKAAEISALTAKASPTTSDLILIEDAADSNNKKKITIANLPAAAPAAHDLAGTLHNADTITNLNSKLSDGDVISTKAAEISALTAKASPTTSDLILIEDVADGNKKKKITIATLPAAATAFPEFQFFADQLRTPTGSEYPRYGSAAATIAQDSANNSILIRQFDDTVDEGAAFDIFIPSTATNIILDFVHRAQTAPGTTKQIVPVLYTRQISDNVATPAWSSENHLTTLDIPTNARYQNDTLTISLASLSLTAGLFTQLEFERDSDEAGDNLVGDWNLALLRVRFS